MHLKPNKLPMISERAVQLIDFSPVTIIFHLFSRLFTLFFSRNCLIFSRLRIYHGLIARFDVHENGFWGGAAEHSDSSKRKARLQ
jgi:hypothetical protein